MTIVIDEKYIDYKPIYHNKNIKFNLILEYDNLNQSYKLSIHNTSELSAFYIKKEKILHQELFSNKNDAKNKFNYISRKIQKNKNDFNIELLKMKFEIHLCDNEKTFYSIKNNLSLLEIKSKSIYNKYFHTYEYSKLMHDISILNCLLTELEFKLKNKETNIQEYINISLTKHISKGDKFILLKDLNLSTFLIKEQNQKDIEKYLDMNLHDYISKNNIPKGTIFNYNTISKCFEFFIPISLLSEKSFEYFKLLKIEYKEEISKIYSLSLDSKVVKIEFHNYKQVKNVFKKTKKQYLINDYQIDLKELFRDNKSLIYCFNKHISYYLKLIELLNEKHDFVLAKNFDMITNILDKFKNLIYYLDINKDYKEIKNYIIETSYMFKEMYEASLSICKEVDKLSDNIKEKQNTLLEKNRKETLDKEKNNYLRELSAMKEVYKQQK